jgi:hypothetical protein
MNPEFDKTFSETVNDMQGMNPKIQPFAKPKFNVNTVDDSGTLHSFAVEIKAKKDGPIPDTQLMSKILQAIESHNTSEYAYGDEEASNSFEVVSFKYERRDDKKKQ